METGVIGCRAQPEAGILDRAAIEGQPIRLFGDDDVVGNAAFGEIVPDMRQELPQMLFPVTIGNHNLQAWSGHRLATRSAGKTNPSIISLRPRCDLQRNTFRRLNSMP